MTALTRIALICALAVGIAGCGVKGPLQPPPSSSLVLLP